MVKVSQISKLANTLSTLKAYESVVPETGAVVNNIKYLMVTLGNIVLMARMAVLTLMAPKI
jgi:hypothetical protein